MLHLLVTWPVLVSCAPVCQHLFPAQLLTLLQLQSETRSRVRARYGEHLVQPALFDQTARAISLFSHCFFLYRSSCCRAWCRWCFRVNLLVIPRFFSVRLTRDISAFAPRLRFSLSRAGAAVLYGVRFESGAWGNTAAWGVCLYISLRDAPFLFQLYSTMLPLIIRWQHACAAPSSAALGGRCCRCSLGRLIALLWR